MLAAAALGAACRDRLLQTLRRTAKGMTGALSHSFLVTLTLWAALLVVGLFAVGLHNLQGLIGRWAQAGHLSISLREDAALPQWQHKGGLTAAGRWAVQRWR